MKKLLTIEREIEFPKEGTGYPSFLDELRKFEDARCASGSFVEVMLAYTDYEQFPFGFRFEYERLETDEEYLERLKREVGVAKLREALRDKEEAEAKAKRYADYQRLKEEFEGR